MWMELGCVDWDVRMHAYQDSCGKLKLVKGDRLRALWEEQTDLVLVLHFI